MKYDLRRLLEEARRDEQADRSRARRLLSQDEIRTLMQRRKPAAPGAKARP
jgi:hypothetical protein